MSRNYEEDQRSELEALESIYYNELQSKLIKIIINVILMKTFCKVVETEPRINFKIAISTEEFNETQDGLSCELVFTLPMKYPDEPPLIEIDNDNFEDSSVNKKLLESLKGMVEENLGMEMIFTLVAGAQELLNTMFDEIKIAREEEKSRKEQEAEEAERKRFEGTIVSRLSEVESLKGYHLQVFIFR